MSEFYNSLSGISLLFFYCAILGGCVFLIKGFMIIFGADIDVDFDASTGDFDGAGYWISVQSISAFSMLFGLGGLTASKQFNLNPTATIIAAVLSGIAMVNTCTHYN